MISIIVPVYNVEKYLRRCLDSILAQTFADFECILIDDGSPDNCPTICDEYAVKDSRIIIIHQKNAGVSAARNAGLDIARGDWISFVDSDDWLEHDSLEKLYNKQRETYADIVIGSFRQHCNNGIKEYVFNNCVLLEKEKMLSELFLKPLRYVWGKLYRRTFFENIFLYLNLVYGEDIIINAQIICSNYCKIIVLIDDILYNYDYSTGGISQGLICSQDKVKNYFESLVFARNYLMKNNFFNSYIKKYFYQFVFSSVYMKMFFNIPKSMVLKLIREKEFPYVYISINIKLLLYTILNSLFFVNQNLYKYLIKTYRKIKQIKQ